MNRLACKQNPRASAATNQPDGQISKTLSYRLSIPQRKNIPLPSSGKSVSLIGASRPVRGTLRTSRNVAAGCGGREVGARRTPDPRTAKSCGPDAPTLASSFREASFPEVKVARKPGRLGEREVSCKPLRRESRRCSGSPVVLPPCFFCCTGPMGAIGTRLSLRPPFFRGTRFMHHSGISVPRGR